MKFQSRLKVAVLCPVLAVFASFSDAAERLSREELIARRDASNERLAQRTPKQETSSKGHPSRSSILDRSIVISNGRNWTFVPKGALLNVPAVHQNKVNATSKTAKYLPFAEFARSNRGWLSTHSVTLEQARGNAPITDQVRQALKEGGRVVVSVCQGGAISTRVPKVKLATAKK